MTLPVPSQRTWATNDIVTAAMMNANVRDAVNFLANVPLCLARQAVAPQSIATATTGFIALDTNDVDTYSGHSTVTNNSRYTAQVAGWYMVIGSVPWANNTVGRRIAAIYKNGTQLSQSEADPAAPTGGLPSALIAYPVQMAVADYVQTAGYQTSGGALNTNVTAGNQPFMAVWWMHA